MTQTRDLRTAPSNDSLLSRPWRPAFATAVLAAAVLTACGGGGGGGSSTPATSTGVVKVSGVAATGAAVPAAPVSMICAAGTGTATTAADGSFTVNITDGALPCVLEATSGATTLHGVALGSGAGTVTAHLTPLTELAIANILGQDPKAYFAALKAGTASIGASFTDTTVASATAAVVAAMQALGIDASALDLLKGDLRAGSGTGYDGVLDALGAKLRQGGSTVADLAAVLSASSTAGNLTDSGSAGMLPVASLAKTAAPTCGAMRSGEYWRLIAKPSTSTGPTDPVTTASKVTLDAAATGGPKITNADTTTETLSAVTGQACRFTVTSAGGTTEYMFAPSGIGFARSNATGGGDTSQRLQILLPVQTMAVSALAGKWNGLGWYPRQDGFWSSDSPVATIAADGKWSSVCPDDAITTPEASCVTTEAPTTGFAANAAGGFDAQIHGLTHRGFAYQSGNGTKLIVLLHANGGFEFLTPSRSRANLTTGATWNAWDLRVDRSVVSTDAIGYFGYEITGVAATTKTESRKATDKVNTAAAAVTQNFVTDSPRAGWAGVASTTYQLSTGLGFTPYTIPGTTGAKYGISVNQPQ